MDRVIMQHFAVALTLTPRSCEAIQRAVSAAGYGSEGGGLRISARRGRDGVKYRFAVEAQATDTDYVIEQQGARVYVDPFSAPLLDGGSVDFVAAGQEYAFALTPPRAAANWQPRLVA
jgi:iron-sulfur cluster assembly accessory protein